MENKPTIIGDYSVLIKAGFSGDPFEELPPFDPKVYVTNRKTGHTDVFDLTPVFTPASI